MSTQPGSKWFKGYCRHCDRDVHRAVPRTNSYLSMARLDVRCLECKTVIPCKTSDTGNPAK